MSTGAECFFYEQKPAQWFYKLQRYPYGAVEDYDLFGPFPTFRQAENHLNKHHANPGGFGVTALPGCKHDLIRKRDDSRYPTECDRCGETFAAADK